MSAQVRVSQNGCTSAIPSGSPTDLNPLAIPVITSSHADPMVRELDSGGQQVSSRRNIATGLERTILARSLDVMWDLTIFVNTFPDPITLTEELGTCWSDAWTKLGFPDFADATPPSNDQVSYPQSITNILSYTKCSGHLSLICRSGQSTVDADLSICIQQRRL